LIIHRVAAALEMNLSGFEKKLFWTYLKYYIGICVVVLKTITIRS
jgi:hypothetical protein